MPPATPSGHQQLQMAQLQGHGIGACVNAATHNANYR